MSTLSKKHNFHEVFDSQSIIRLVLEAISNPSRVVSIKAYADKLFGQHSVMLSLAMTLLDNEVNFHACQNHTLAQDIVSLTLAHNSELSAANFVFVCDPSDLVSAIQGAKCGSLADPHKSATLMIQNDQHANSEIILYGPGIDGQIQVKVSQIVIDALQLRDDQYYEYPQGIDLIFVTSGGDLFALPRLVRWEVK